MTKRLETYSNSVLITTKDDRTLQSALNESYYLINAYRDTRTEMGIWYMGHFWDSSETTRNNLTSLLTAINSGASLSPPYNWRDKNNITVGLTYNQLVAFSGYMVDYINSVYYYSWGLKTSLGNAANLAAFDAIDIYSGWPDGNMDGTKP